MYSVVFNESNNVSDKIFENGISARHIRELYIKCRYAIYTNQIDFLSGNIEMLPDINLQIKNHTLLTAAIIFENWQAVELLLDHGANPNIIVEDCGKRFNALDLVLTHVINKTITIDYLELLLKHGAYYDDETLESVRHDSQLSALFRGYKNLYINQDSIEHINDKYVKREFFTLLPKEDKQKSMTLLSTLINIQNYHAISEMIDMGFDLNMSRNQLTPLMQSVIMNDSKLVLLFLKAGANVNIVLNSMSFFPHKALNFAIERYKETKSTRIIETLLLYDAKIDYVSNSLAIDISDLTNLFHEYSENLILGREDPEISEDLIREYEEMPPVVFNTCYIPDNIRTELDRRGITRKKQAEYALQKQGNANELEHENKAANNENGGCYIATAVYGSADSPQVVALRMYRDSVLLKNIFGRLFVRVYYLLSPFLAKQLKKQQWRPINLIVRSGLDRFISSVLANTK